MSEGGRSKSHPLNDQSMRDVISNQRESLRSLICENSEQLRHLSYSGSLQKSIHAILNASLKHKNQGQTYSDVDLECSGLFAFTEDDFGMEDYLPKNPAAETIIGSEENAQMIEISPEDVVPLRGSLQTWRAVKDGCITVTACHGCSVELHVVEDALYVVCPDCWVVSPVDQMMGGVPIEVEEDGNHHGVGLGVKAEEIIQWLDEKNA